MVKKKIRRTLFCFVEDEAIAKRRATQLKKIGATHVVIRKKSGAFGVYGKPSAIMKKQRRAR